MLFSTSIWNFSEGILNVQKLARKDRELSAQTGIKTRQNSENSRNTNKPHPNLPSATAASSFSALSLQPEPVHEI